jgi:hypothetical protein
MAGRGGDLGQMNATLTPIIKGYPDFCANCWPQILLPLPASPETVLAYIKFSGKDGKPRKHAPVSRDHRTAHRVAKSITLYDDEDV